MFPFLGIQRALAGLPAPILTPGPSRAASSHPHTCTLRSARQAFPLRQHFISPGCLGIGARKPSWHPGGKLTRTRHHVSVWAHGAWAVF